MSGSSSNDPLMEHSTINYSAAQSSNPRSNPELDATLSKVANNFYEAVIEDDEEFDLENHDEDAIWLRQERIKHKSLTWLRRPSIVLVTLLTFFFALAMGSGISAKQVITLKLACNTESLSTGEVCNPAEVQVMVSNLQMAYTVLSNIIMLVVLAKICALSDQYGRTLFLAIVVFFSFLGTYTKYLIMSKWDDLKFIPMVITEVLSNAGGGPVCLMAIANCYLADIVESHERIFALGLGTASLFVGLSMGPLVGNAVLNFASRNVIPDKSGDASIFQAIASHEFAPIRFELILQLIAIIYAFFILPESRSEKARSKSRTLSVTSIALEQLTESQTYVVRAYSSVINLFNPLKLLFLPEESLSRDADKSKIKEYRITIWYLILADAFLVGLGPVMGEICVLYGFYKFGWHQQDIGHLLATICASKAFVLIIVSPILNHKVLQKKLKANKHQFDTIDLTNCLIGFGCEGLAMTILFFSRSTLTFLAVMPLYGFGVLALPTMASSIIKFYPESKVGEVYGAMALVKNIVGLVSPVAFLSVYKFTLKHWNMPGFSFLLCAALQAGLLGGALYVAHILKLGKPEPLQSTEGRSYTELHRKNSFVRRERTNSVI